MAWIESHQGLATHRKLKAFKRALRIKTPQAIGHLHLLWWWALDNAADGKLAGVDPADIAEIAMWPGNAEKFLEALKAAGFVDPDLSLHDWDDYAGKLIDRRKANTERVRQHRNALRSEDVTITSPLRNGATVPYRTVPNSTVQNSNDDKSSLSASKVHYGEFKNVLLTPEDYANLIGRFRQQKADDLIERLSGHIASTGKRYRSHYATILNWERREKKDTPGSRYTGGDMDKFKRGKYAGNIIRSPEELKALKEYRNES
jgi:hypothetical protein